MHEVQAGDGPTNTQARLAAWRAPTLPRLLTSGVQALALAGAAQALAQVPPPSGGGILKDLERSLPTRPLTSPQGARIEVPDAPALAPPATQARVTVRDWRVTGNTVFDEATLRAVIADATGDKSVAELHAVADRLTAYYRDRGYLLARAYLPQQEIQGGVVTIAVLEGRYDKLRFDNTSRVSDQRVQRTMTTPVCGADDCAGALIERAPLERGLLLLNDTPGASASARLSPGGLTGTSTLDVVAAPEPLLAGQVQVDNGGSYYSGQARAIGTLAINSPAGIGDQVTLQAVATDVHGNMQYGAAGYTLPVGYSGARVGVRGSYLHYELGNRYEPLDAHGTVKSGDLTAYYPFIRSLTANLSGTASIGTRRFRDQADAVGLDTKRRISGRTELALQGDLLDQWLGTRAYNTATLGYTSGKLELDPLLGLVDTFTARTAGHYGKWTAGYSRLQSLSGASSLFFKVAVQGTRDNLDAYEKFALGGPEAVRAYPAGDTLADRATLYTVEWRQGLTVPGMDTVGVQALQAVLFYDHARGRLNARPWDATAPNQATLEGVGVGLNAALAGGFSLRTTLAWRGGRQMSAAPDNPYTFYLTLGKTF
jgi:hemolysin activation/secretion protein